MLSLLSFLFLIIFLIKHHVNSSSIFYRLYETDVCEPDDNYEMGAYLNLTRNPETGVCVFFFNIPHPTRFDLLNSSHLEITIYDQYDTTCSGTGQTPYLSKHVVKLGVCLDEDPFDSSFHSIFETVDFSEIPFDPSVPLEGQKDYIRFSTYSDDNCTIRPPDQPYESILHMNLHRKYVLDYDNGWYYPVLNDRYHNLECNDEYFIDYVLDPNDKNLHSWILIAVTKIDVSNRCQKYRFFQHYLSFTCVDESKVDTSIPPNLVTYQRYNYYFNYQCYGTVFAVKERKTGQCINYGDFTNWKNYFNTTIGKTFVYENGDCTGEIYEIHYDIYDQDLICTEHKLLNKPSYGIITGSDTPLERNEENLRYVATFSVESCDVDHSQFEEWKKTAQENKEIVYYDSEFCMSSQFEFFFLPEDMSLKGYCDEELALLYVKNYSTSGNCEKSYSENGPGDYCITEWVKLMTCIPAYCSGIPQYDTDIVCNGHGKCIETDTCECEGKYYGTFCDLEDVDKDYLLAIILSISLSLASIFFLGFVMCLCCICLICCCCCCGFLVVLCLSGFKIFTQQRKLKRFTELDDIYMMMQESDKEQHKLLLQNGKTASIQINKKIFDDIDPKSLKIKKILGEGGSDSCVYLCMMNNSRKVAFKCFRAAVILQNQDSYNEFEKEYSMLDSLRHPNIVRFFGCLYHPPSKIGFVMEYCSNGDLRQYMSKMKLFVKEEIPFDTKLRILHEVSIAMAYLHTKMIIHRDLKCENVLLDQSLMAKLVDFGISRAISSTVQIKTKKVGTNYYIAPEIVNSQSYNEKCDVFSFSILVYILITENFSPYSSYETPSLRLPNGSSTSSNFEILPFFGVEMRVAANPYFRPGNFPGDCPLWIKDFCCNNWEHDPKKRNSFAEIAQFFEQKRSALIQLDEEVDDIVSENITVIQEDDDDNDLKQPLTRTTHSTGNKRRSVQIKRQGEMKKSVRDFTGILVFIKLLRDHKSTAERFLLMERTYSSLLGIISSKYEVDPSQIHRIYVHNDEMGMLEIYKNSSNNNNELTLMRKISRFSLISVEMNDERDQRLKELELLLKEKEEVIGKLRKDIQEKTGSMEEM